MEAELFFEKLFTEDWYQNVATIFTVLYQQNHTVGMFGEKLLVVVKNNHTTGKRMSVLDAGGKQ